MAVILSSVYKDGTASIAAGGTVVTGQGTLWLNAVLPGDFFGVHKGFAIRIASVDSNTQLTLANPWPGAAQATAAYEIMLQSDVARMRETTRQLLVKLSGGNLDSLAELSGVVNDIPIFTGAGAFGKIASGAKGRTLVTSPTTLDVLTKLGPVFGGPAPEPMNADVDMVNGDFNTLTYPGLYTVSGNWANGPFGAASAAYVGVIEVISRIYSNHWVQILRRNNGITYRRRSTSLGVWPDPWEVIESPTVGTCINASGVPFGAVMERGSNANGEYTKFADGTMIVTSALISGVNTDITNGSLWHSGQLVAPFPATFSSIPTGFGASQSTVNIWVNARSISTANWGFVTWASSVRTAATLTLGAIGRWF